MKINSVESSGGIAYIDKEKPKPVFKSSVPLRDQFIKKEDIKNESKNYQ